MKKITFLFFLFSINISYAQVEKIQDYTKDGVKDTIRYNGEEEFYGEVTFINGATSQSYQFYESEFSRADFLGFVFVPEALVDEKELLDSIVKIYYPHVDNRVLNPALDYLLSAYQSNQKIEKGYFSQFFQVPNKWNEGEIEKAEIATIFVKKDEFNLPDFYEENISTNYGWLFYAGHNHIDYLDNWSFSKELYKDESIEIHGTQHGLILKKDNKYTWIFHSNHSLTSGPGKLRWKSIEKILVYRNYVFLHHVSPITQGNRVFMIDLKTGKVARLRLDETLTENSPGCFGIEIYKKKLRIISKRSENCNNFKEGEEELEIKLKSLFKQLKKLGNK